MRDDGAGFDPARREAALAAGHVGLASSEQRVRSAGGELIVSSTPGGGHPRAGRASSERMTRLVIRNIARAADARDDGRATSMADMLRILPIALIALVAGGVAGYVAGGDHDAPAAAAAVPGGAGAARGDASTTRTRPAWS